MKDTGNGHAHSENYAGQHSLGIAFAIGEHEPATTMATGSTPGDRACKSGLRNQRCFRRATERKQERRSARQARTQPLSADYKLHAESSDALRPHP